MNDFKFNPETTEFDIINAHSLARAATLAYGDSECVLSTLPKWGFSNNRFFDIDGTQGFVGMRDDMVLLAFRGTQPTEIEDIIADLDLGFDPGPVGRVHQGFQNALGRAWDNFMEVLAEHRAAHPQARLWITGHSLGAALGTVAAARCVFANDIPVQGLYTFGSPRVGDSTFAKKFKAKLGSRTHRFRNNNDVVARVPLPFLIHFRYRHVGRLHYLDVRSRLRHSLGLWAGIIDRLRGRIADFGKPLTDGLKDHSISRYQKGIEHNLEPKNKATGSEIA